MPVFTASGDYTDAVLEVVALIPPGRVMTYGDVAWTFGRPGARAVGMVMRYHGSSVAWWRVIRAGGHPPSGLAADARVILVFGGSLGARLLNDLALDAWAEEGPAVIHLCGERDYPELEGRVRRADYLLRPFMDEIGVAYGAADIVLARAGGSVWELAAAGLDGLEVLHPRHSTEDQLRLSTLAQHFGLVTSGGSDWHGPTDAWRTLGMMRVPPAVLDAQRERAAARRARAAA